MASSSKGNISKSIVKALGIFGGVQFLNILCSILRAKLVALWIGPVGIGLFGLYNSAIDLIFSVSSLGIRNSSIRDIAMHKTRDGISTIIHVVRRWSVIVGVFGALITLTISPMLSKLTFGDDQHIWGFVALSVVLFLNGLAQGEQAILQGTSMLKRLAKSSVWGVASGVVISIPLFYFFRIDSIIPAIIAFSLMSFIFTYLYRTKEYDKGTEVLSLNEIIKRGSGFVKLGIFMTLSSFITLLFSYAFMAYLNHTAGTNEVGFYQAGYTLINKYVGVILTAISMEYFPRLSSVNTSKFRTKVFVSQELNITLLILIPVICLFILFRSLIVEILYAKEFIIITEFISWAILGTIFRAISWCMAFVILARGDGKLYMITESLSAVSGFILNIVFYQIWGLTGLGISFLIWYMLYTLIIGIVYLKKYRLTLSKPCVILSIWGTFISGLIFLTMGYNLLIISSILALISITISGIGLKKILSH